MLKSFFKWMLCSIMLILSINLTSCSKDDDPTEDLGEIPTLPTPAFASSAACYEVISSGSGISSIEITESGEYIVVQSGYRAGSDKEVKNKTPLSNLPLFNATRASYGNVVYGKVIKISDTEYVLEGFGTIVIEGDTNNAISIIVTTIDGETIDLSTQKAASTTESPLTAAMCRSWNLNNIGIRLEANRTLVYEGKKPAAQLNDLLNEMENAIRDYTKRFSNDPEDWYEPEYIDLSFYPNSVLFSRAGTYMVGYSNDAIGLAKWKWVNENDHIFHYSWNYINPDAFDTSSGDATITFSGSEMVIREDHFEGDMEFYMKTSTIYYCN